MLSLLLLGFPVFILCYMLAAPVFGYLGDWYNRKIILGAGISFWSGVTLSSSFISELVRCFFLSPMKIICLCLAGVNSLYLITFGKAINEHLLPKPGLNGPHAGKLYGRLESSLGNGKPTQYCCS